MTNQEINDAITRLRTLDPSTAAKEIYTYASRLLPIATTHATPANLAALWIIALGLYDAAVHRSDSDTGVVAFLAAIEASYAWLNNGSPHSVALEPAVQYPEDLQNYLRALSQLPSAIVLSGIEKARDAVHDLLVPYPL